VAFYRGLGFFAALRDLSDRDLAERLAARHEDEWDEPLPPPASLPPMPDILVMTKDPDRAWWLDLECDALPANDVYVDALRRLERISNGKFAPEDPQEIWEADESHATVSFALGATRHEIPVRSGDGWFDAALVSRVNDLIAGNRGAFCVVTPGDQTVVILYLTDEERTLLAGRGVEAKTLTMELRR
jgi:hypothetical protein